MIAAEGRGVVVYLRGHEGRGIGLAQQAPRLRAAGRAACDTVDANLELGLPVDSRDYGVGAQILADLGVRPLRLLTNNPAKYGRARGLRPRVVERVALPAAPTPQNVRYLRAKQRRMGHLLDMDGAPPPAATAVDVV